MPESLSTQELKRLRQLNPKGPYAPHMPMWSMFMGDDAKKAGLETLRVQGRVAPGSKPIMRLQKDESVSTQYPYVFARGDEWALPPGWDEGYLSYYNMSGIDSKGGFIDKSAKQVSGDKVNVPAFMTRASFQNNSQGWPDVGIAKKVNRPAGATTAYITLSDLEMPQIVPDRSKGMGAHTFSKRRLGHMRNPAQGAGANSFLSVHDLRHARMEGMDSVGTVGDVGEMGEMGNFFKKLKNVFKKLDPIQQIKNVIAPPKPKVVTVIQQPTVAAAAATPALQPPTGTVSAGTPGSWTLTGNLPSGASYSYSFSTQDAAMSYGQSVINAGGSASLSQVPQQQQQPTYSQPTISYSQPTGGSTNYQMPQYSSQTSQGPGSTPAPQPTPIPPVSGNVPLDTPNSWNVSGNMPDGTPYSYNFMTEDAAGAWAQNVANGGGTATVYSPDDIKSGAVPGISASAAPAQASAGTSNGAMFAMLAIPAAAYFYFKHR